MGLESAVTVSQPYLKVWENLSFYDQYKVTLLIIEMVILSLKPKLQRKVKVKFDNQPVGHTSKCSQTVTLKNLIENKRAICPMGA